MKIPQELIYSNRVIASIETSLCDPLGILMLFIMLMCNFLRNIWAENLNWYELTSKNDISTIFQNKTDEDPRRKIFDIKNTVDPLQDVNLKILLSEKLFYSAF